MKINDHHIETYKRDGFVVIENFLTKEETQCALAGFQKYFPPDGRQSRPWLKYANDAAARFGWLKFPSDDSALNHVFLHPDIIDAAERIHGDTELLIADGMFGVRYAGEKIEEVGGISWHVDYRNNILGPEVVDRSKMHLYPIFGMYLNDIGKGDAPIRMMRHGQSYDDAVDIVAPAGSLWIYSLFTHHTATLFTNPTGFRAVASTILTPRKRLYDVARLCTQKSGADGNALARVIREATPQQLELFGFPKARDPFWTDEYVTGMEKRYPGFKGDLYRHRGASVARV